MTDTPRTDKESYDLEVNGCGGLDKFIWDGEAVTLNTHVSADFARTLELECVEWKKKYYDVADAITRESTGVEDLCRQAREIRKAAYADDGTPWSTISEWWRAKFEAAENHMALERADNARLREAGDYLAKCVKLAGAQPNSMADLMCQKWESAKSACIA